MSTIALTTWNATCKVCDSIRTSLISVIVALINLGEAAGRARAASHLAERGYYKEAQRLMNEID